MDGNRSINERDGDDTQQARGAPATQGRVFLLADRRCRWQSSAGGCNPYLPTLWRVLTFHLPSRVSRTSSGTVASSFPHLDESESSPCPCKRYIEKIVKKQRCHQLTYKCVVEMRRWKPKRLRVPLKAESLFTAAMQALPRKGRWTRYGPCRRYLGTRYTASIPENFFSISRPK